MMFFNLSLHYIKDWPERAWKQRFWLNATLYTRVTDRAWKQRFSLTSTVYNGVAERVWKKVFD